LFNFTGAHMQTSFQRGLVWFRRDLRPDDHAALYHALTQCKAVWCVFVFDTDILAGLPAHDRRVTFIHDSLRSLDVALNQRSPSAEGGLMVLHGRAATEIPRLAQALGAEVVFANHDDEPPSIARDAAVRGTLAAAGIGFHTGKDHVIFERDEVLTLSGHPFSVFTPYKNAWLKKVDPFFLSSYPVERHTHGLAPIPATLRTAVPALSSMGFEHTPMKLAAGWEAGYQLMNAFLERISSYHQHRDFPAVKGPSYLGVHLRFGTVSIRTLARIAYQLHLQGDAGAATWLSELIWRDFYAQILAHHPAIASGRAFKPDYDRIHWERGVLAQSRFRAWCDGQTGYPLVDAAMRQINQTGYMHNRLRMIVASFLVKDLGIDWRWGERYFAQHLNDFDLASNNGGWQWASSSGCDAQPYFRIFNPTSQSEKFDASGHFIRRYVPELAGLPAPAIHAPWKARPIELSSANVVLGQTYPRPVVEHDVARQHTLERYAVVKKQIA
jgi:deoxyribodipyrimidine photo-lyase